MPDTPSGGPRESAHTKAGTRSGGASAIPTPANNVSSGGHESSDKEHDHLGAGRGTFGTLEKVHKQPVDEGCGPGGEEDHSFARQKPGGKSVLGQWMEK